MTAPAPAGVVSRLGFLRRRFAAAIECGADATASRLQAWLDTLLNGDRPA